MMAKPMKALELHYPMIQFLIMSIISLCKIIQDPSYRNGLNIIQDSVGTFLNKFYLQHPGIRYFNEILSYEH